MQTLLSVLPVTTTHHRLPLIRWLRLRVLLPLQKPQPLRLQWFHRLPLPLVPGGSLVGEMLA